MRTIITILACITIVDCLTGAFGFMNMFDPLPSGFAMSAEWRVMLGVVAGATLIYQAIRFAMWLAFLVMRIQSVAEGVALQAWHYAERLPNSSHRKLWLKNLIVKIGRKRLGLTRFTAAKGVVDCINGVEKAPQNPKPVYDGPRVVAGTQWKDAA